MTNKKELCQVRLGDLEKITEKVASIIQKRDDAERELEHFPNEQPPYTFGNPEIYGKLAQLSAQANTLWLEFRDIVVNIYVTAWSQEELEILIGKGPNFISGIYGIINRQVERRMLLEHRKNLLLGELESLINDLREKSIRLSGDPKKGEAFQDAGLAEAMASAGEEIPQA
jgi:hypothetical protein